MKTLHLICNAHIDPIWQWTWDEGISAAVSTFKSAADLCGEFDYIFCHNEALLYSIIEEYEPKLFERIKKLVKSGKWNIMGGWYLQPDCNMPSGESIVRNILRGRQYFEKKFGARPETAINFDSFGHSIGLVQIMKKTGYNGYIFCRPNKEQYAYPDDCFKWAAPDGSEITAAFFPQYNTLMGQAADKIRDYINKPDSGGDCFFLWGVGNHGGGPSRKDLSDIKALTMSCDVNIIHSTPDNYMKTVKPKIKVSESLNPCMPGCYSSMAKIKQWHRKAENNFYMAEKIAAVAAMNGMRHDGGELDEAEKAILLTQFHDILPGTCVKSGEENGLNLLGAALTKTNELKTRALFYLLKSEDKAADGEYPVFVFNNFPYPVKTVITAEFQLADQNWSSEKTVPSVYFKGKKIVCQQIKESSTINLDWRKKIVFTAELEPLKLNRFSVYCQAEVKTAAAVNTCGFAGGLQEIIAGSEQSILKQPVLLRMYDDTADPWGMSRDELISMGANAVDFKLLNESVSGEFSGTGAPLAPVRIIEDGAVQRSAEAVYGCNNTKARIEYNFYKNADYLDINIDVEFCEKNKMVRLFIPSDVQGGFVGDGPYLIENKFDSLRESVFQKFCAVRGEKECFGVINNGIYAGRKADGGIELTLLRGAGYCIHPIPDRELYPKDRYLERIDSGNYSFSIRLIKAPLTQVIKCAEEFNQPPAALNAYPADINKSIGSLCVSDSEIIMSSLRKAENQYIIRMFNPADKHKNFIITALEKEFPLSLEKYEIGTFIFDGEKITKSKDIV